MVYKGHLWGQPSSLTQAERMQSPVSTHINSWKKPAHFGLGWSVCLCLKLLLKFSQPFLKIVERYDVLCGLFEAQIIYMIEYEDCSSCVARIICLLATCHPSMTSQPAGAIFRLHPMSKRSLTEFAMLTTVRSESSDFDLSATDYRVQIEWVLKFQIHAS